MKKVHVAKASIKNAAYKAAVFEKDLPGLRPSFLAGENFTYPVILAMLGLAVILTFISYFVLDYVQEGE